MATLCRRVQAIYIICIARTAWGIIGGQNAIRGQLFYMISFQLLPDKEHFCGGGIISEYWIVSAAECFQEIKNTRQIIGCAGCLDMAKPSPSVEQEFNLHKIVIHPEFKFPYNNIALIKSETKIEFGVFVYSANLSQTVPDISESARIAGWGRTDPLVEDLNGTLKYLEAPLIHNEECMEILINAGLATHNVRSTMLCILPENPHSGGCEGDQGGPLTTNLQIIGIMCFTNKGCVSSNNKRIPIVFTRVANFLQFIKQTIIEDRDEEADRQNIPRSTSQTIISTSTLLIIYLSILIMFIVL